MQPKNITYPEFLQFRKMTDILDFLYLVGCDVQRSEFFLRTKENKCDWAMK